MKNCIINNIHYVVRVNFNNNSGHPRPHGVIFVMVIQMRLSSVNNMFDAAQSASSNHGNIFREFYTVSHSQMLETKRKIKTFLNCVHYSHVCFMPTFLELVLSSLHVRFH
jgi:hypothetical protein